jgi:hypothetical protein
LRTSGSSSVLGFTSEPRKRPKQAKARSTPDRALDLDVTKMLWDRFSMAKLTLLGRSRRRKKARALPAVCYTKAGKRKKMKRMKKSLRARCRK